MSLEEELRPAASRKKMGGRKMLWLLVVLGIGKLSDGGVNGSGGTSMTENSSRAVPAPETVQVDIANSPVPQTPSPLLSLSVSEKQGTKGPLQAIYRLVMTYPRLLNVEYLVDFLLWGQLWRFCFAPLSLLSSIFIPNSLLRYLVPFTVMTMMFRSEYRKLGSSTPQPGVLESVRSLIRSIKDLYNKKGFFRIPFLLAQRAIARIRDNTNDHGNSFILLFLGSVFGGLTLGATTHLLHLYAGVPENLAVLLLLPVAALSSCITRPLQGMLDIKDSNVDVNSTSKQSDL